MLKKKIWASFQRMNFLIPNLLLSSQKYGFGIRDPRAGIQKKPIQDPGSGSRGSKKAPDPGSGSATLNFSKSERFSYYAVVYLLVRCMSSIRDSGIDTSSCFTGSEDSNHRDSRTSKVSTKDGLSTKPKSIIN
jgi:hypothetical protein